MIATSPSSFEEPPGMSGLRCAVCPICAKRSPMCPEYTEKPLPSLTEEQRSEQAFPHIAERTRIPSAHP